MNRILLFLFVALALPAWAQAPLADGEVRRVNKRTKEITLKHGPIPSLAMEPMTMAFPVKDPAMLDRVKAGDKVKFTAEMVKKEAVITRIEVVK
jgi:Cu(I)/Ag(I) efflux system periplasmic protein CusF